MHTFHQTSTTYWSLRPDPTTIVINQRGGSATHLAVYDLNEISPWPINIRASYTKKLSYGIIPPPLIHATRFVGGKSSNRKSSF